MTHRLDVHRQDDSVVFELQGLVDLPALESLEASVAVAVASGVPARVVLRAGTEVDRACLARLGALRAEIVAESAYLARWIAEAKER